MKHSDNRGNRKQNIIFIVLFIIGAIIAQTILFAPIHEHGHVFKFQERGFASHQIGWNTTSTSEFSFDGLFAGYSAEFTFFYTIFIVAYLISSPDRGGLRRFYGHLGFPFGYANGIFVAAFSGQDFHQIPRWTSWMSSSWIIIVLPLLIFGWIILFTCRLSRKVDLRVK